MTSDKEPRDHQTNRARYKAIRRLWDSLTAPHSDLVDREDQRRARLLSTFLLVIIGLFLADDLQTIINTGVNPITDPTIVVGYVLLLVAYALSRTRHSQAGAVLTVTMFVSITFALVLQQAIPSLTITFLIPGLVLASILFSVRGTAITVGVIMLGMLLLPVLAPERVPTLATIEAGFGVNLMTSVLLLVAMWHRNQVEKDRLSTLSAANEALARSRAELEDRVQERTQDIEQAATALRASQERFALAVDGSNDGIWDWNVLTNQVYFSPRWKEMIGYEDHEIVNEFAQFENRLHPDDHDRVMQAVSAYLAGELPTYAEELRLQHKDGSYRWILVRGTALRNEAGEAVRMAGSHSDISEQKESEDRILQEQERTRAILESVTVPLVVSRISDGVALYINEAISELMGMPMEALQGQATPDFYYDPEERTAYLQRLRAQGYINNYELQLKRANGAPFWALVSARIIDFEGETAVITTLVDITARREAQEAITKRAAELSTVAQVGTAASTILDPDDLLQNVVDLTRASFDLYHAHIYLLDDAQEQLVLSAGAGTVGKQMVAEGRQILLNQEQSLVARAARSNRGVTVNDVRGDPGFLPNPLLPDTRSEMAVPIAVGGLVLGVLDVQAAEVGRFAKEDVDVYTTLAAQIAVALQNAQQYEQTQSALAETETLLNVTQITSRSVDLDAILEQVLDQVLAATDFDIGMITIFNQETQALELRSHRLPANFDQSIAENSLDGSLCDFVFRKQESVVVFDLTEDSPVDSTGLVNMGYRSYQGVPLQAGGSTLGTICIFSTRELAANKTNLTLLQAVSQQIGVAIQNAILFAQTQAALTEAEATRRLVENATQGIGLVRFDGRVEFANQTLWQMLEKESAAELEGDSFVTYLPGEEASTFNHKILPDLMEAGGWQGELELLLPSAKRLPVSASYFVVEDRQGKLTNVAVILTDISDRKQAEANQQRLRSQLEEQLAQMNALQRAMTREGWEAFLTAQERIVQGYQFSQDSLRLIARRELEETEDEQENVPLSTDEALQIAQTQDRATAATPMQLRGETIGFLGARDPSGKPIDAETQQMLQQISAQVAEALERARLFEVTELARSQTEALYTGSDQIVRANQIHEILLALVDATALRRFNRASILFFDRPWQDEAPESMTVAAAWVDDGSTPNFPAGTSFPVAQHPVLRLVKRDEPLLIQDIPNDPRMDENSRAVFIHGLGAQSVLAFPLVAGDLWTGLVLGISDKPQAVSDEEIRQVVTLSSQAAVVAQTQRLFRDAETRARQEQLLREVTARVSAAVDAESVLQTATREIGRALGLQTFVYLKPPQQEKAANGNGQNGSDQEAQ